MNVLHEEINVLKHYGAYLNMVRPLWNHSTEKSRVYQKCSGRIFSLAKPEALGVSSHFSTACAREHKEASKERTNKK